MRFGVHRSEDVDLHARSISQWSQEYDQLSRGRFRGLLRELWMEGGPRIQVFHEHTAQRTSQRCLPWRGSVWFGIPDGRVPLSGLRFCGRAQPEAAPALLSVRGGGDFSLNTPQDFGIYGFVVDEDWLQARLPRGAVAAGAAAATLSRAAPLAPGAHRALCETLESLLRLGASGEVGQPHGRAAVEALLAQLPALLGGVSPDAEGLARLRAAQRRLRLVMAARELATQPGDDGAPGVEALCARLHVTRRTLQNHFQATVGESPADFLKAVRLNACRRALRAAGAQATVQEIAGRWGFFHMGHFSQDYRQMFGEPPSRTLRAARCAAH